MTPGTRTRVSPGCCDGAEAERAPARRTSPITIPPAPAHRLLAQRCRVRSSSAAPRRQSLTWVVAWWASASQASRRCADLAPSFFAGGVTRRAVVQRRSRASGLTRLSAAAIRGFGLGFVAVTLSSSAAVWCKLCVFSFLSIRKALVLILGFRFLADFIHSRRRSYYLFFTTCSLLLVWVGVFSGAIGGEGRRFQRSDWGRG